MKTRKIIGIGIISVVVIALGLISLISYDMNNRATVFETLAPNGASVGNALVVYDPSITGNTKNVASLIAEDLQAKGYQVNLVGIKNPKAENTLGYSVIVVGGPIYGGNTGESVKAYLETLKVEEDTKIGVFAIGDPHTTDESVIKEHVAPIPKNSTLKINTFIAISMVDDKTKKSLTFVNNLLN